MPVERETRYCAKVVHRQIMTEKTEMQDSGNAVGAIKPKATHSGRSGTARKAAAVAPGPETATAKPRGKQSEDYTGFRSSHLTAIEPVLGKDGRKDYKGYTIWLCKCDCGRFAKYESRALKSGRAKDCGDDACPYHAEAIRKRYRFEDLTGKRFGKLVVIGPVMVQGSTDPADNEKKSYSAFKTQSGTQLDAEKEIETPSESLESSSTGLGAVEKPMLYNPKFIMRDLRGRTLWKCVCDCGNTIVVPGTQLTSGYRKSCGCLFQPPLKDWAGKQFGMLTVISYDGKREGKHWWKCRCDCGNETSVAQSSLQSGHTTSCGCLMKPPYEYRTLVDGTCVETLRAAVEHGTVFKSNRSGVRGVYWDKRNSKWTAQITFKGKTHYLGSYTSIHEAEVARKRGEDRYFGEFLEEYDSQASSTV